MENKLRTLQSIFDRILKNRKDIEYEALQNEQVRTGKSVKRMIERMVCESQK